MGDLAKVISDAGSSGALQMRTGRITYLDAGKIIVQIAGGDPIPMASPRGNQLVLGDYVQVLGQGGTWWCLGTPDGVVTDGVLANPSFEVDVAGTTPPTSWGIYHDPGSTGTANVTVSSAMNYPVAGTNILSFSDAGTTGSNTYVYSEAIPVGPGQTWTAAAYANPFISGTQSGSGVELALAFFSNATNTYPTFVAQQVIDSVAVPLGGSLSWLLLRQHSQASGVTIPDGAGITYMRVVLNAYINGPGGVDWDCVICRRLA